MPVDAARLDAESRQVIRRRFEPRPARVARAVGEYEDVRSRQFEPAVQPHLMAGVRDDEGRRRVAPAPRACLRVINCRGRHWPAVYHHLSGPIAFLTARDGADDKEWFR